MFADYQAERVISVIKISWFLTSKLFARENIEYSLKEKNTAR